MRAIDLFGGCGGLTRAAEAAGVEVVWAATHWPLAVRIHKLNHPKVEHVCQDLRQADWRLVPSYDILLAGPSCQPHSEAAQPLRAISRAVRQRHDAERSTAWAVVDCADTTNPKAIVVENVPAFLRWRLYPVWKSALERMDFEVSEHILTASYHRVPQRRRRVFVIATKRRASADIRAALHARRTEHEMPFGPCVDWEAGEWRRWDQSTPNVRERVRRSRAKLGGAQRFLTQHTSDHTGVPLDEPIRTITTKDQWCVVDGPFYRPLLRLEYGRGMSFADSFLWPDDITNTEAVHALGNAVPPELGKDVVAVTAEAA